MISKKSILNAAVIIGVIYLFMALNPFIFWILWPGYINFPLFLGVIAITLVLIKIEWTRFTSKKLFFAIPIFLFMVHIGTSLIGGAGFNAGKLMSFTSLICILFFSSSLHLRIFEGFRKLMLFFSWFSILVFSIILIGIDLPYYKIPAFTLVMENSYGGESFYKLYGFVVSSTNTVYNIGGLSVARICGPFQEPGHFAIYLGIVLLFEKMIYNKLSKGFVIAGILTFSPNFFIIFFIILLYDVIYSENKKPYMLYTISALLFTSFLLLVSPEVKDELFYLTIGRNFDQSGTDIASILDDRAGKQTLAFYEKFINSNYFLYGRGVEFMEQFGVLSDWRGMILKYGLIGLLFSLIACIRILTFATKPGIKLIVSLIILLIYLQRSWMFESPFMYLFLIIGLISLKYKKITL